MYRKQRINSHFSKLLFFTFLVVQLLLTPFAYTEEAWKPDRNIANELISASEKDIEQTLRAIVPEQERADYALMIAWQQTFKLREYQKARTFLKLAEDALGKQTTRHNDWATLHMLYLTLSMYEKDYENAVAHGKETLTHLDASGDQKPGRYAYILDSMNDAYYTLGDYENSLNTALMLAEKASSEKNEKKEASALFSVAESYYKLSRFGEGETAANRAYALYEKQGDTKGLGHTKKVLGSIYKSQGNLEKALQSYNTAIQHYKKARDHHGLANCMYNLGNLKVKTKDYGEAILSYEEAAFHYIESGSASGAGMAKMELGKVQELMNSLDKTQLLYEEARSLLTKSNATARLAQLEYYYAALYIKQGKTMEAKDAYLRALNIYRKANNQKMITWIEKQLNKL